MLHGRVRPFSRTRAGAAGPQYDFTTGSLPAGMTFTRASAAWGFNSAGVLTSYATDAPRFVYDPVTLQNLGLLIEGTRTNGIRNNTMVGAVTGTAGTVPTNWRIGGTFSGLGRTITGIGTEDGIDYIEFRFFGTPTGTAFTIEYEGRFTAEGAPAAANGQVWTASVFVRVTGGDLTNVVPTMVLNEDDAAGVPLGVTVTPTLAITGAPLRTQRYTVTRTFTNAGTTGTNTVLRMGTTPAAAIDVTVRIGLPQLEQGEGVSSPVKTSTVAVTRALDTANITDARVLTDKCHVVRGRATAYLAALQVALHVDDGTAANRQYFTRDGSGNWLVPCNPGPSTLNTGALALSADFASAARFATNDFAASLNGSAVVTDTAGVVPATLTAARIGRGATGSLQPWNSTIKSIETRPTASDAELQALSAAPVVSDTELWMTAVSANGGSVSAARKAIIEQFIAAEKAAGTWDLTDDYWPLWGEDAPQALTSLKQRRLATAGAAPTFTADRGYVFNGTTQYVDTGWLAGSHAIVLTGTDQRIAAYERTDVSSTGITFGAFSASTRQLVMRARNGTGSNFQLNSSASGIFTLPVADSRGWTSGSRAAGGTTIKGFKNGVPILPDATGLTVANSLVSPSMLIGAVSSSGTPATFRACSVGFACVGAPLTAAQEAAQYANVQAWATAVGAQV